MPENTKAPVSAITIVGIGSPFGTDRVGWDVLDALAQHPPLDVYRSHIKLATCDRPGPRLLEYLRGVDLAVLVDAVRGDQPDGVLYRLEGEAITTLVAPVSSHGFGVAETLALGRSLGDLPQVVFHGVEIGPGWRDRAVPRDAVQALCAAVTTDVARFFARGLTSRDYSLS